MFWSKMKARVTMKEIAANSSRNRFYEHRKLRWAYLLLVLLIATISLALYMTSIKGLASDPVSTQPGFGAKAPTYDGIGRLISLDNQTGLTDTIRTPRFWDKPLSSGEVVIVNDQQILKPGPSDEVRLILQLSDDPVSIFKIKDYGSGNTLSASEIDVVRSYENQLISTQKHVIEQLSEENINIELNGTFVHVFNGIAVSTEMGNWPSIEKLSEVKAVFPDFEKRVALNESVPLIEAPQVWNMKDNKGDFVTGNGVRVAIIDTGIDYTHPDLGGCLGATCRILGGYDFVNHDNDPMDDNGHGTHVAGIVGANGNLKGVAPDSKLLAYKVCDAYGSCWNSDIISALEMAADPDGNPATNDGPQVINLSLGGGGSPDDSLSQAVDNTVDLGIVVAAAAGNYGPYYESLGSPAVARKALTVAASDKSDKLASFSSRGPVIDFPDVLKPDITAPGVSIGSTVPISGDLGSPVRYQELSGTSMATPHIAGAAALIKQLHPTWTPDMIKANLMNTAKDLGMEVYEQGAGRVQLEKASTTSLIVMPGSFTFGNSFPGTSTFAQLTVVNVSNETITFTASISASHWADGLITPITPTIPVDYVHLIGSNFSISPNEAREINVNLDIPSDAQEGYYIGEVSLQGIDSSVKVPFAFTLLSKITVHILDENGDEWFDSSWNNFVLAVRVPELRVIRSNQRSPEFNDPPEVPVTFYVPSGKYNIHGIARGYIYGLSEPFIDGQVQKPLLLATTADVTPNSDTEVYLDASNAHLFKLNTTTFSGNPQFISEWGTSFRYLNGGIEYRLGYALMAGSPSSDNILFLPDHLDFYISDTPDKVGFTFYSKGTGYSPRLEHFIQHNSDKWFEGPEMNPGMFFESNSDEMYLFGWQYPKVDNLTTTSLAYTMEQVSQYRMKYDYPGVIVDPIGLEADPPYKIFGTGFDCTFYMPISPGFCLADIISAGRERRIFVKGAFAHLYIADNFDNGRFTRREYYLRDWTKAYEFNPNEFQIDGWDLAPEHIKEENISFGTGSLYPAASFDNSDTNIRLIHPLFGNAGKTMVWGGYWDDWYGSPKLAIIRNGIEIYSTWLYEMYDYVFPMLQYPVEEGSFKVKINANRNEQISYSNTLEAGFTLPSSDMNPPQVLSMEIPQRFTPDQPITVTFTVTDTETEVSNVVLKYSADQGGNWMTLPLTQQGSHYSVTINPGSSNSVSLDFKATDQADNYLAFTTLAAAIRETPVTLSLNVFPEEISLSSEPFTVTLSGSLKDSNGQPLSEVALPIAIYVNDLFGGYVRDIARMPDGTFKHGEINFDWTFIPTDFVNSTGPAQMRFVFDIGTYSRQEVTHTVNVVKAPEPTITPVPINRRIFLPLVKR
jgi:subtilisin family serine protease